MKVWTNGTTFTYEKKKLKIADVCLNFNRDNIPMEKYFGKLQRLKFDVPVIVRTQSGSKGLKLREWKRWECAGQE